MRTFVIIKAPRISDAILAANERGIILSEEGMRFHRPSPRHSGEVHAFASAADAEPIRNWFHETDGGPCNVGACLWFSEPRYFGRRGI